MDTNLHAHVETYSVDCDGPIERAYILPMVHHERMSQFGDIEFHDRIVAHVVNTYTVYMSGTLTVQRHSDDHVTLAWSEQTEEGHRSANAYFCTDDCDIEQTTYRDIRAEGAGY